MPVVQGYTPQTTPQGQSGGYLNVDANPDAFGAGVGRAEQGLGQAIEKVGDTAGQIEQQRFMLSADANVSGTIAQYHQAATDVMAGYGEKRGYDAANAAKDTQDQLAALRSQYAGKLTSPIEQRLFNQQANGLDTGFHSSIIGHAATEQHGAQMAGFDAAATAAGLDYANYVGKGLTAPGPDGQPIPLEDLAKARAEQAVVGKLELQGLTNGPAGADILAQSLRELHSNMAVSAVQAQLNGTDEGVDKAAKLLQDSAGVIDPVKYATMTAAVSEQQLQHGYTSHLEGLFNGNVTQDASGAVYQAGSPQATIASRAATYGVDPKEALAIAAIESGFKNIPNTSVKGSTSAGIFQFSDKTWKAMGGTDANRNDPQMQIELGLKLIAQNDAGLTKALGRKPTIGESYLAHQQGLTGALALINAPPNVSAVAALEGAGISSATALASIKGNLPGKLKGKADSITAADFSDLWAQKVQTANLSGSMKNGAASASTAPAATMTGPVTAKADNELPSLERVMSDADGWADQHAPGDGRVKRQAEVMARSEWNRRNAVVQQQASAVYQSAVQAIQGGGDLAAVHAVPGWDTLKPTQQRAIESMVSQGGHPKQSDDATYVNLNALYANDPKRFSTLNLMDYGDKLSASDFKEFSNHQAEVDKGQAKTPKAMTIEKAMTLSNRLLAQTYPEGKLRAAHAGAFQGALMRNLDQFRAANGKEPQDKDVLALADSLLLNGSWKTGASGLFVASTAKGHLFDAPVGAPFKIDVPSDARDRIISDFKAKNKGALPSEQLVQDTFKQGHAAGVFH